MQTALVYAVTLTALMLLSWTLGYWASLWAAIPEAEPPARISAQAVGPPEDSLSTASGLFGIVQPEQPIAASSVISVKLLGVAAAPGGRRGHAILLLDETEVHAVLEGEDITPGIRLAEVLPDHAILERNGMRETLAWPAKNSPTDIPALPENRSPAELVELPFQ